MGRRISYSDEFKQEAVRLVTEQGMRPSQVARDLGVGADTLRRWRHELAPAAEPASGLLPPAAEVAQLRRENEQLRLERDILKKALGIFSRMPQ